MGKILGNFETFSLAVNGNNAVIPYNARRVSVLIGSTSATAAYVQPGTATALNSIGFRISPGQAGFEMKIADYGDLVKGPFSVWNAGSAGATFAWAEGLDSGDL